MTRRAEYASRLRTSGGVLPAFFDHLHGYASGPVQPELVFALDTLRLTRVATAVFDHLVGVDQAGLVVQ